MLLSVVEKKDTNSMPSKFCMRVQKKLTAIPRLELIAAVVSVKLNNMLKEDFGSTDNEEFFWTDSNVGYKKQNEEGRSIPNWTQVLLEQGHDLAEDISELMILLCHPVALSRTSKPC